MRVFYVLVWTTQIKVFPITDSGHQFNPYKVRQPENRGALGLGISVKSVWLNGQVEVGDYSPTTPTDPDVQISRIRFLSLWFC